MVTDCRHGANWRHRAGESRCEACGTRRFTDYAALRPPGLPEAVGRLTVSPVRHAGVAVLYGRTGHDHDAGRFQPPGSRSSTRWTMFLRSNK
ncbi:DUF6255 family natural product biosynthesis protein [Streptomyces olivoverticillatus]|uniref:DUF6255 family natural product biosynthesis protein n=1 Tax=Streptomyces olivoverticillatus TaxID=66427 RepID=UPI001C88CA64